MVSNQLKSPQGRLADEPKSTIALRAASFDHLVGAREQRRRHVDAQRLGSLVINDQLELSSAPVPAGRRASRP
jgi:hypothetical protein